MTAAPKHRLLGPTHKITRPGMLGGWTGTGERKTAYDAWASNHHHEVYRHPWLAGEHRGLARTPRRGSWTTPVGGTSGER
jgi:hypothetical protein